MATRYVVFNRKGGVGKSTIVANLAAVAAVSGRRTLVVDLDPQTDVTRYLLGRQAAAASPTIADYFEGQLGGHPFGDAPASCVHRSLFRDLDVIPASPRLAELQPKLEARFKIYKLRDLLEALDDAYDDVFLDTPPATGFFTTSALIAAERCLIPFDCDDFSRQALYQLLQTVEEVRSDHNPALVVGGIVVNQFQERASLPQRLVDQLKAEGLPVLEPYLTTSIKIRESHQQHRPLVHLAPGHKLTERWIELYRAIARS